MAQLIIQACVGHIIQVHTVVLFFNNKRRRKSSTVCGRAYGLADLNSSRQTNDRDSYSVPLQLLWYCMWLFWVRVGSNVARHFIVRSRQSEAEDNKSTLKTYVKIAQWKQFLRFTSTKRKQIQQPRVTPAMFQRYLPGRMTSDCPWLSAPRATHGWACVWTTTTTDMNTYVSKLWLRMCLKIGHEYMCEQAIACICVWTIDGHNHGEISTTRGKHVKRAIWIVSVQRGDFHQNIALFASTMKKRTS